MPSVICRLLYVCLNLYLHLLGPNLCLRMRDFQERGRQDWRPEVPLSEEQKQRDLENLVKTISEDQVAKGAVR